MVTDAEIERLGTVARVCGVQLIVDNVYPMLRSAASLESVVQTHTSPCRAVSDRNVLAPTDP